MPTIHYDPHSINCAECGCDQKPNVFLNAENYSSEIEKVKCKSCLNQSKIRNQHDIKELRGMISDLEKETFKIVVRQRQLSQNRE